MMRAFKATQSGMSVYRACRFFSVPESTLRDRTRNNVALDARSGPERIFSLEEEQYLVNHIKYMADIGYGYTKANIQNIAGEYSRSLGKKNASVSSMSAKWFYGFLDRWPDLKMVKPQKLQMARAKNASEEVIKKYFTELGSLMREKNLINAPERIYNIDETGISTEHTPRRIICDRETKAQAITSARTSNVTIIAGANAMGNLIPPFYIFPGQRWIDALLDGAAPGSAGQMSQSGWSNSKIFEHYIQSHLSKHAGLFDGNPKHTLVLYDGHKSHISLTLTEWAKKRNVTLFVLPPHTSHLTQPLDIAVFGPLKSMYNIECQDYLYRNPGIQITRYEVAELTSKPYAKALCPENITSGFRRAGIFPFNRKSIAPSELAPATIYRKDVNSQIEAAAISSTTETQKECPEPADNSSQDFFGKRTITVAVQRPKKRFAPPFIMTGNLLKPVNIEQLKTQAKKTKIEPKSKKSKENVRPSTSGTASSKKGGPINISTPDLTSDSDDNDDDDTETCCFCQRFQPEVLHGCPQLVIIKWGKCDFCPHWTHLTYCSDVRVLRRDSVFRCPHCVEA